MSVTAAVTSPSRSSYIDGLRAVAIARVYLHHTLWITWLTALFPSMWVMFALAGFLTARSMERGGAARTVRSRIRRLLPPLWGLAAIAVPLMLIQGWRSLQWPDLLMWVVPLANPPTSDWAGAFALALWYLRAYLWFVLLSPLLWWAFKRWPIATLAAPLAGAAIIYSPLFQAPSGRVGDVVGSVALYGTSWMLGFARYSGMLDRLSAKACALWAGTLALGGLAWGLAFAPPGAWLFTEPVAEALWGTAFVVVLMRMRPSMDWLHGRALKVIAALNARAVTIYVWHLPVLLAAGTVLTMAGVDPFTMRGRFAALILGTLLLAITVGATGWIEDLAARRRPAVVPAVLNVTERAR